MAQVISDDKHYSAFVCKLCERLVSLDAVVTTSCSHPFCRPCMTDWAQKQIDNGIPCSCPKCEKDLTVAKTIDKNGASTGAAALMIGDTSIMVQPLEEAQPLALQVLEMIQVVCAGAANGANGGEHHHGSRDCEWTGDYGKWQGHRELHHHGENGVSSIEPIGHGITNGTGMDKQQYAHSLSRPSLFSNENNQKPAPETAAADSQANLEIDFVPPKNAVGERSPANAPVRGQEQAPPHIKLERGQSARIQLTVNNIDAAQAKNYRRQYKSASDLMNKAMDDSSGDQHRQDLMGDSSRRSDLAESINGLETSYGNVNWNGSHNSFKPMSPSKLVKPIATVDEEGSEDLTATAHHLEEEGSKAVSEAVSSDIGISSAEAIERSEKLKKQANAKFNKGDFEGARSLYSDGINVMTSIKAITKEECSLVATLFSNRAVTYFREKVFDKCIDDCDKALEYEATFEKSYIRKWRALMALGNFEEACECLEEAHRQIPSSRRVKEELTKAREQRDVLSAVNTMIDGGNLEKAKETIKPLTKESDNIGLLLVAAMADAGLGLTEAALEKVNKALRFNPNHAEALQLRGLVLFLSGDMEKGVRLLQELHSRHADNAEIKMKLDQCQNTLSAFSKGRNYAKRGRYKEAVEQFTFSMDDQSLPLPTGTALYCLIKIERAEALLLAKHYAEALKDCKDALDSQNENAEAWALKAEIFMCLGRASEAKEELAEVRQTWGRDNIVIEESYRKANFEEKVRRVDDELMQLINDVEAGVSEEVIIDGRDGLVEKRSTGMHQSERRYGSSDRRSEMGTSKRPKSYRSLNKGSEKDRRSNRKDKRRDRDRSRARGEGSSRTMNTQVSSRTLNTTATGVSSRTMNTRGTSGASHRVRRTTRKKSNRKLMVEKDKVEN